MVVACCETRTRPAAQAALFPRFPWRDSFPCLVRIRAAPEGAAVRIQLKASWGRVWECGVDTECSCFVSIWRPSLDGWKLEVSILVVVKWEWMTRICVAGGYLSG